MAGLGGHIAVHRAECLNPLTKAHQRFGAACLKAGNDIVVRLVIQRHRRFVQQAQQALCIHSGFQCLAHGAGGGIQAQKHFAHGFQRAADLTPGAGGRIAVAAFFHQIAAARNIAAGGGNAAAGVFDKAARDQIRAHCQGLTGLGKLAVAVVHKHHNIGVGSLGGFYHLLDLL